MTGLRTAMIAAALQMVSAAGMAGESAATDDLHLSAATTALLQAEMREIAGASQALVYAIASGDWHAIERISDQIRASYVMEKELSAAQREELEAGLPGHFKALDAEFHARGEKLGSAAAVRDPELVTYQLSRMLETCVSCHSRYARQRFPGFAPPQQDHHQH